MKRIWGLSLFCVGIGMSLMYCLPRNFATIVCIASCLIVGYNLFCCR